MVENGFKDAFGYTPEHVIFTPGRVNLIGEHTDYNGGMVLPTALPLGITLAMSLRSDDQIRIHSDKFKGSNIPLLMFGFFLSKELLTKL